MALTFPLALLGLLAVPYFIWLGRPQGSWARTRSIVAVVLRTVIVVLLVLALAGLRLVRSSDSVAVVFLVDASDSMPPATIEEARSFAAESIDLMRPQDQAAIIVFGSDALVERPMSPVSTVGQIESDVLPLNTDLAEAIRLGLALFPPGAARRMVILSDGQATVGDAAQAAQLAAASGVEVSYVPVSTVFGPEVIVTDVDVPTRLNEGQKFDLTVTVESSINTQALLRVIAGGDIIIEQAVELVVGVNRYAFNLVAGEAGLAAYRVQVIPEGAEGDTYYQNNELSAFTQIVGPPRVLVVSDDEAESANLEAALLSQGIQLDRVASEAFPLDLGTLSGYQSIVLANIPARNLGRNRMQLLQAFARDLGGGVLVVGGPDAYGPGGYFLTPLEEMLPLEMQLKDQSRLPQMAIVYVIDRSGSMSDFSPGGFSKIELAKEAILRSLQLLSPLDRVGVVTFDTEAAWAVPLGPSDNRVEIGNQVAGIRSGGGTDIYAGLLAVSRVLPDDPTPLKHIVLLTDGGASEDGIEDLVETMYEDHGITLSVIAITAPNEQYGAFIDRLPELADGRFHHAFDADTIPEIFTEEMIIASRAYIIEHEFFPSLTSSSPILTGIQGAPSLQGYIGTSIKPLAQQILVTDEDDPLLAAWQYGLGRVVAWTSDATGRWAANWVAWPDFARFWAQAVRWTITEGVNQNVEVRVVQEGERVRIIVDAVDGDGSFLNGLDFDATIVAPDLVAEPLSLHQVAPGRYEAVYEPDTEGAYFVRVTGVAGGQNDGVLSVAQTSGWVLAYSPEYRAFEGDSAYLDYVTGFTGGGALTEPGDVFRKPVDTDRVSQPFWPFLLLAATLLLPFDIAVRRLIITRSDWARFARWIGLGRRATVGTAPARTSRVGGLLDVKDRVSREQEIRHERPAGTQPAAPISSIDDRQDARTVDQPSASRDELAPPQSGHSTASSLLASKRRRREQDE